MKSMTKNRFLRLGITLFAALCFFLFFEMFLPKQSKSARADVANESLVVASVDDVINAKDYDISCNGSTVKAEGMTVVYPSGGLYGGESITMHQAGLYQVTYYANVDGQRVEETKNYMAVRRAQDLISGESGMPIHVGKYEVEKSPYELTKETYGTIVEFKEGQSITFNASIETSKLTASYNILEMIVVPSVFQEKDFEKLTVRVTDSADENNYVDIIIIASNMLDGNGQVSYVQAGASGQQYGGYEGSRYHMNSPMYGTQVEHSFCALAHLGDSRLNHTVSENMLTIAIDNETKKVYCGPTSNMNMANSMVNDLDDPVRYLGNPWGGFIGDEVTVKVTADRFSKPGGKVLIKSFGDFNLSNKIEDTQAPTLKISYDKTAALPLAKVGSDFPIFPYMAKDLLDQYLKTEVFVYYIDTNGRKINVENDGNSFFVKYAGNYQIVYRAEDFSGNVEEKTLSILAQNEIPEIVVTVDPYIEMKAYETAKIPLASEISVSGGCGYLTVERFVYDPSGKELDVSDELYLTQLGDYRIVYEVTDYVGNVASATMTVNSGELDKPYFVDAPSYDAMFVKGFTYEVSQARVIETLAGEIREIACKAFINDEEVSDSFKAAGDMMTIRYVAEGATGTTEWTKTIPVVDTEKGRYKSKYFYTESDMNIVDEKAYLQFDFSEASTAEFINPLPTQNFALTFSYEEAKMNFAKLAVIMIDSQNKNHAVTIYLLYNKETNAWFIQTNGSAEKVEYMTSKNILSFALRNGCQIMDASGISVAMITSYDNGKPFAGFGDTVYLRLSFEEVAGDSSMYLTQVGNQSMGYNKSNISKASDEIKPIIVLDEPFLMRQKLGAKAQIPTAKAYDVLGQIKEFTVTIETVKDGVLASGSAKETLDYTLSEAGTYLVTYYAKDSNGNFEKIPYAIRVSDETAPTLTVKDSFKSSYKLNAKISVPSYKVSDNNENCYVQVTVTLPNNEVRLLQYAENGELLYVLSREAELYEKAFIADEDTFVALYAGKYVLRVVAYDDYYNYTAEEFEFIVK